MNKIFAVLMLGFSVSAFAASPPINFTTAGTPSSFNSTVHHTATVGGITVDAFTYSGGAYTASQLWLRNDGPSSGEFGFGVCSEGTKLCGPPSGTGNGDYNELSNEINSEVIRLTLPTKMKWSNLFVSSLDTGGSHNNESGILYWSNSPIPLLSTLGFADFSHTTLNANYGSIWSLLPASFNPNDKYLFFTPDASNGTNNDYLVWGAGVSPVPEPSTYAMMLAGLGLIGFIAYRRKNNSSNMLMAA